MKPSGEIGQDILARALYFREYCRRFDIALSASAYMQVSEHLCMLLGRGVMIPGMMHISCTLSVQVMTGQRLLIL